LKIKEAAELKKGSSAAFFDKNRDWDKQFYHNCSAERKVNCKK